MGNYFFAHIVLSKEFGFKNLPSIYIFNDTDSHGDLNKKIAIFLNCLSYENMSLLILTE